MGKSSGRARRQEHRERLQGRQDGMQEQGNEHEHERERCSRPLPTVPGSVAEGPEAAVQEQDAALLRFTAFQDVAPLEDWQRIKSRPSGQML
eukprot:11107058-Alexandrium_andersonii.AAC.1